MGIEAAYKQLIVCWKCWFVAEQRYHDMDKHNTNDFPKLIQFFEQNFRCFLPLNLLQYFLLFHYFINKIMKLIQHSSGT